MRGKQEKKEKKEEEEEEEIWYLVYCYTIVI
jgi:hypothetical protein